MSTNKIKNLPFMKLTSECKDCGRSVELFTLKDKLWAEVSDHYKDFLCISCCELRLGRSIQASDFDPEAFCNKIVFDENFVFKKSYDEWENDTSPIHNPPV